MQILQQKQSRRMRLRNEHAYMVGELDNLRRAKLALEAEKDARDEKADFEMPESQLEKARRSSEADLEEERMGLYDMTPMNHFQKLQKSPSWSSLRRVLLLWLLETCAFAHTLEPGEERCYSCAAANHFAKKCPRRESFHSTSPRRTQKLTKTEKSREEPTTKGSPQKGVEETKPEENSTPTSNKENSLKGMLEETSKMRRVINVPNEG
eukprot:s4675_g6.t1